MILKTGMQQYLKYFALILLLPAKYPLLAQGISVGKDSVLEREISEGKNCKPRSFGYKNR